MCYAVLQKLFYKLKNSIVLILLIDHLSTTDAIFLVFLHEDFVSSVALPKSQEWKGGVLERFEMG